MGELMGEKPGMKEMGIRKGVQVPRLSDSVVRSRAESAYAYAVGRAIQGRFNSAPPASELRGLTALLKAQIKASVMRYIRTRGRSKLAPLDVDKAMASYARKKPKSVLATYYKATGSNTAWLDASYTFSGRGRITIKFKFRKSVLQKDVRASMLAGKTPFGNQAVKLNNPKVRTATLDMSALRKDMPVAVKQMCQYLIARLKHRTKGLKHFSLAYSPPDLEFTSKLPKRKRVDYKL